MVETRGVDSRDCKAWRELIAEMDEEFVVWSRTFRRVHGVDAVQVSPTAEADEGPDDNEEDELLDAAE